MATFVGDAVAITVAGNAVYVLNGQRWTIDAVADEVETTAGWNAATKDRSYGTGWQSWSGSYECRADSAIALTLAMPGTTGVATFTYSAGRTLIGTIFVTGMSVSSERSGEVIVTITFRGSGALAPA